MPTVCCCGNPLEARPGSFTVRMSPCKCGAAKGGGRSTLDQPGVPAYCFEQQYKERTRLGLPLETDIEKGVRRNWY